MRCDARSSRVVATMGTLDILPNAAAGGIGQRGTRYAIRGDGTWRHSKTDSTRTKGDRNALG